MLSIASSQKKHENQKNASPHRNHDFQYFFFDFHVNRFFRTHYEKKSQFTL